MTLIRVAHVLLGSVYIIFNENKRKLYILYKLKNNDLEIIPVGDILTDNLSVISEKVLIRVENY